MDVFFIYLFIFFLHVHRLNLPLQPESMYVSFLPHVNR